MPARHGGHGGGRRGRAHAYGRHRRHNRRRPFRLALSARGGNGRPAASTRHAASDREGPHPARGLGRGPALVRRDDCRSAWRLPSSSPASGCRRLSPTRDSPSPSTWTCCAGWPRSHEVLVTVEEGSSGGFGAIVLQALAREGLLDRGLKVRTLHLPDRFIEQNKPQAMYAEAGLDARRHRRRRVRGARQGHRRAPKSYASPDAGERAGR